MSEYVKYRKALEYIIDGFEVKMVTTDFKGNIFTINKNEGKPIKWIIIRSSGSNLQKFLTFDEFKEKFKDNFFYKLD